MAKLKSFEQFLSEMDRTEEVQQDVVAAAEPVEQSEEKAEEVQGNGDAVEESTEELNEGLHPKLKKAQKAIKKGETVYGENVRFPGRFKIIELGDMFATVDYEDGTKPMEMASMNIKIDSLQFESVETEEVVTESGEEAGLPAENLKDETEVVDNDCETPEDKSDELEAELEDTVDAAGNEEISEAEETEEVAEEETEEVAEEEEEVRLVSDMLKEVYESCKNEAKAWEDDAHDEHTVETYMKENAALVGALAAQSLKEMKEDYSVEAYEAACNEMIESYSKKVNEMKESDSAVGEETPEA